MKTTEETAMNNRKEFSYKNKNILSLVLKSSVSSKYNKFFQSGFFNFSSSESYFPKNKRNIRLESSISGYIRKGYARVLDIPLLKHKKSI